MARRQVPIHQAGDIAMARRAGQLAAELLSMLAPHIKPGITTNQLDKLCHDHIVKVQQAVPANIGYHGYPKTLCASVNQVVCHGIPSDKPLADGDIVNIDVALIKDGWYGDTSRMFLIGQPGRAPPGRGHLCGNVRRHPPGAARRHARRRRPCHPERGRKRGL